MNFKKAPPLLIPFHERTNNRTTPFLQPDNSPSHRKSCPAYSYTFPNPDKHRPPSIQATTFHYSYQQAPSTLATIPAAAERKDRKPIIIHHPPEHHPNRHPTKSKRKKHSRPFETEPNHNKLISRQYPDLCKIPKPNIVKNKERERERLPQCF